MFGEGLGHQHVASPRTRPQAQSGKDAEKAPSVSISCLELSDNLEKQPKRTKVENIPAVVIEIKKMPNKQPESSL